MLILIKILTWLASPMGIFVSLSLFGLIILLSAKKAKLGRFVIAIASIQLVAFASPAVADRLMRGLEDYARALAKKSQQPERILTAEKHRAIVLLGGATSPANPPERPNADLNDAADRIWHAARLFKQGVAPTIIVTGGKSPGLENRPEIETEAQSMRQLLLDFGVPDSAIMVEDQSRNTRENASKTKTYVGEGRIALVTSASHMPRAYAVFERANVKADAFPTDFRVAPQVAPLWARILPNGSSLERSEAALKEYLATLIKY